MVLGNSFTPSIEKRKNSDHFYYAALFPINKWINKGNYSLSPALIHAFIRQESRFNPNAQNYSGATGLMQLMPSTASYILNSDLYKKPKGQEQLKNPVFNVQTGEKYLQELLKHPAVKGDLLSLIIAYNAGPAKLRRWKTTFSNSLYDPLLFIESIPYNETRAFVERVVANYWVYQLQFNEANKTAMTLAKGKWAKID